MLSGDSAASNVGIIFKISGSPIVFYDTDNYKYDIITNSDLSKTINLTADYYRMSDSSSEITSGSVKGMLEVIIQEE